MVRAKGTPSKGWEQVEERTVTEPLLAVPAKEVAGKFGFYTDEALLHPVGIQRHGVTRVVMLSLQEYERLLRRDRQVLDVRDLDDEDLEAIQIAEGSKRAKELDYLMEDSRTSGRDRVRVSLETGS